MDLVASGRTAEVFALDDDRVLKLDRLEWNGVSHYEAEVVNAAHVAGLPVPAVHDTVIVDGRHGIVLEYVRGPSLATLISSGGDLASFAVRFVELLDQLQADLLVGLSELVPRLDDEVTRSGLHPDVRTELRDTLVVLARGQPVRLCHFDLHAHNIIVTDNRWVVIDWLTAANGPAIADLGRTLLLGATATDPAMRAFLAAVRREACERRGIDDAALSSWTRVLAAARLAEGFDGPYADSLAAIATETSDEHRPL